MRYVGVTGVQSCAFFVQAEDGIRDVAVTGVQTCALPISAVIVEGAADAVREFGASVILVGNRDAIEREIARLNAGNLGLEIRHASQVVEMAESPSQALRRKRDSSLRVAAELVRDGHASAFISAGNTGAAMAIAMFVIGVLRGIDRPAIATVLPSLKRATLLLDVGANVAPKPWHLFQFALMGHAYARDILGVDNPRVGLLSVGEEEGKGNELTRDRKSTRLNSSHGYISYAVFCLKKKTARGEHKQR